MGLIVERYLRQCSLSVCLAHSDARCCSCGSGGRVRVQRFVQNVPGVAACFEQPQTVVIDYPYHEAGIAVQTALKMCGHRQAQNKAATLWPPDKRSITVAGPQYAWWVICSRSLPFLSSTL